jgi:beta-lactamase regulating signal transducer with metallopeptidase domain
MIALWMIYATVVASLVGSAAALLERSSAGQLRQRRWIWAAALAVSFVVPSLSVMPSRGESVMKVASPGETGGVVSSVIASSELASRLAALVQTAEPTTLGSLDTALSLAWLVVTLLALGAYGVANWVLAHRRRSWRPANIDGQPVLLSAAVGPAVIGALRPEIVVPEWSLGLPDDQRALMLEHERQHVRARDPLMLHAAAFCALLMPWNVAVWWLNRRLRLAVELDCDARVLASGRDARTYGTLLLNVCSRRARTGVMLAPALLERTSSLAKRILAMQVHRGRFARARIALGAVMAGAVILVACEMPTPEMLAPDGKDAASQRLYGQVGSSTASADPGDLVKRYFPSVARGEGGPSILFLVKSATGDIVMAEKQPAAFARMPAGQRGPGPRARQPENAHVIASGVRIREPGNRSSETQTPRQRGASGGFVKTRTRDSQLGLPTGIGAINPDDIAAVDITKHAAGGVAPEPISIITIVLKKGATISARSR